MLIPQINIVTVVDVLGALSDNSLEGNMYMMDNSRSKLTTGKGTGVLSSAVRHTQVINWHVWPVDVQTDTEITNIKWFKNGRLITDSEDEPCAKSMKYGAQSGSYWAAVVKFPKMTKDGTPSGMEDSIPGGIYHYQMEILMTQKTMMSTMPSLKVII